MCLVTQSWKSFGDVCSAHFKPSQKTKLKWSTWSIFLLSKCTLAWWHPQLVYRVVLMDGVTLCLSKWMHTGSFGYVVRLYGPLWDCASKHSCVSLSAMVLKCSGIVSKEYFILESEWPKMCPYLILWVRDSRLYWNENKMSAWDCFSGRDLYGLLPCWRTPYYHNRAGCLWGWCWCISWPWLVDVLQVDHWVVLQCSWKQYNHLFLTYSQRAQVACFGTQEYHRFRASFSG